MAIPINLGWDEVAPECERVAPADALVRSVRNRGRVDMSYIATLTGLSEGAAADALGSSVYLDPASGEWQRADQYLSGDIREKLSRARAAAGGNRAYQRNVKALEEALPPWVPAEDIYVQIGSPWIPVEVIKDFIHHLVSDARTDPTVLHDAQTGSWDIKDRGKMDDLPESRYQWGTANKPALSILEATLNGRSIRVYTEVDDDTTSTGKRRVVDRDETLAAIDKQRAMCEEFQSWIWSDALRTLTLERLFNERYARFSTQRFDGTCLSFPGLSPDITLHPHERDAVMRILFTKNLLLAHDVGAGKTYTCIAAGMELKRLDASERLLYVVPNNVVGQWKDLFAAMYPAANVLVVTPSSFTGTHRKATLKSIRKGHHDAVVVAASVFDRIPLSVRFRRDELLRRIRALDRALMDPARATLAASSRRRSCAKQFKALDGADDGDFAGLCLDDLGITRLFVDEAHNYKNIPIDASADIVGLGRGGSKKCEHMLGAVRCVQRHGGGIVFATGTVLTNSMADAYVFQTYLEPGALAALGIADFDAWAGMFARRTDVWEIDVDTSAWRLATRFSGFSNLGELSGLLGAVADFHHIGREDGVPECDGRNDIVVPRTAALEGYLRVISHRADTVRAGGVKATKDNLLKICTDGRRAALDIRLVNSDVRPGEACKVWACAKRVARIWRETAEKRSTQLVFCDVSTPVAGCFNVYDELKDALETLGIPRSEVAFVHSATTETARSKLFAAVREGRVRVLLGSTPKLGLGVNVQDRLVAEHHLDVPWRPADMVQREGRILRQGNTNERVQIFRYVTQGSFDAYSWQLLESKQQAIDELLSGTFDGRDLGWDIGDAALSYGEIKALAVGDPQLRERIETANELERARILLRRATAERAKLSQRSEQIVEELATLEQALRDVVDDEETASIYAVVPLSKKDAERGMLGQRLAEKVSNLGFSERDVCVGSYRGFDVVVPAMLNPRRPQVDLVRNGRYPVNLSGCAPWRFTQRMDGALNTIARVREDLSDQIDRLRKERALVSRGIDKDSAALMARVGTLEARLAQLDATLEANKDEKRG